ncbi:uncharacterized protein LOC103316449 [Nasonia vitripennis]|uniref:Uncharacterized protein n=1 Tax=Nasonia vitripennis TaxID=7425 RepID=A0A7M7LUH7_NASVI|nr:uncharacterized protein LOC103316449 [Nasonia vitripennis]
MYSSNPNSNLNYAYLGNLLYGVNCEEETKNIEGMKNLTFWFVLCKQKINTEEVTCTLLFYHVSLYEKIILSILIVQGILLLLLLLSWLFQQVSDSSENVFKAVRT